MVPAPNHTTLSPPRAGGEVLSGWATEGKRGDRVLRG